MKQKSFKQTIFLDLLSGLTVSFAALSLGAAFGVMSGRGAISGMIGASVIPIITSLFGGTRLQASGPTAPMTAVTALIIAFAYDKYSHDTVYAEQLITLTILLSSFFIITTGLLRLGRFIQMVPQVVVLGFMNGIGALIWYDQIKKLFGLFDTKAFSGNLTTNITIAFSTLAMIYIIPFLLRKLNFSVSIRRFLPSILLTIFILTLITSLLNIDVEHVQLGAQFNSLSDFGKTIKSYFPSEQALYSVDTFLEILPFALQLCLLAYLDSLLTSLVIDKITKENTRPNKELIAQGAANAISGIFQGIPGAQATIRSVLLLKEGAQTRMAGVFVGVFALLGFLVFSNLIMLITSAVFVGVLLKAGLDVFDRDFIKMYIKRKWINNSKRNIQMGIILTTTIVTVLIDLNVAVVLGTTLFYAAKKYLKLKDVEDNFIEVQSEDIAG